MKRIALLILLTACASKPVDPGVARMQTLIAQQPRNAAYHYALARNYDRLRDVPNVLRSLSRLHKLGWDLGIGPHHFASTRNDAGFIELAAKLEQRERAVHRATTAFTFSKERDVRSEGIAYDPIDDRFYFSGNASSVLRVDRNGTITDLPIESDGQKFERLGMRIDAERRHLWTVAAVFDAAAPAEEKGQSVLSVYDLRDGRLVRRIRQGSAEQRSTLNDIALLADGTAFVTDTQRDQLLRLAPAADAFEVWVEGFRGPNGIASSSDGRTLYVTDFFGIHAIDIAARTRRLIETNTPLHAIDGLLEHRGTLIGIQNNMGRPRVVRVHLPESRVEVLEAKNPLLHVPSTAVVAGNELFFMANRTNQPAERVVLKIAL